MVDKRISELTSQTGAGLLDADLFIAARSGTANYRLTRTELVAGLSTRTALTITSNAATVDANVRYAVIATLSATATVTLPAANAVPAGTTIIIADESGSPTVTKTIDIKAVSGDTINKVASSTNYPTIRSPYGSFNLVSDGTSNWTVVARTPKIDVQTFTTTGSNTWRKPFGCEWLSATLIGGGGGGGSGGDTAGDDGGGGGQAGGITTFDVALADLGATETVTVGTGGGGGAGGSGVYTAGTAGGDTHFGSSSKWVAEGGAGGAARGAGGNNKGKGTVVGAVGGAGGTNIGVNGTAGTRGLGSNASGPFAMIAPGGGGGGSGGNEQVSNTNSNGGNGGASSRGVETNAAGLTGGAGAIGDIGLIGPFPGGVGVACITISASALFGGSGGGGSAGSGLDSYVGGNGGIYGAGGGGGCTDQYFAGGGGGNGAQGAALLEAY